MGVQINELGGKRVLVAGAGVSGLAAADALIALGAKVTVTDVDPAKLEAVPTPATVVVGLDHPLPDTVLVVTSPGWHPDNPLLAGAAAAGVEVIGEPELARRWGSADAARRGMSPPTWLAVTGTNGKTTTVGMLEQILRAGGQDAVACGNIGLPVIAAVRARHRVLAVELSSFQLHWCPDLRPVAGCVLNLADDHLDWHGTVQEYKAAKARVLTGEIGVGVVDDPGAEALLAAAPAPRKVGVTLGEPVDGQLGVVDGVLVDYAFSDTPTELALVDDVRPAGPPGLTDALAATALARAHGVEPDAVQQGLRRYQPDRHRAEPVASVAGVEFIDDSKATNPHAANASLSAHPRVVWIAGGLLKGARVDDLVAAHRHRLVGAVLLGTDQDVIADALARHAPDVPVAQVGAGDDAPMSEAVRLAAGMARPGDVVLLAPAAASLDQFSDYRARGRAFADAVGELRSARR
ncbi:MAG: murD [Pseudonocardia sp.]|nr:murD [Pseudonocardia sp.]